MQRTKEASNPQTQTINISWVAKQSHMIPCLKIVSANCFDITGAISAGLPVRISGEQIGGMWKSMAGKDKYQLELLVIEKHGNSIINYKVKFNLCILHQVPPQLES